MAIIRNKAAASGAAATNLEQSEGKKSLLAYRFIKERIKQNTYAPGSILSEEFLVKELGMSRTPIRDATRMLAQERFLEIYPNRGILVTPIDLKLVENIFIIRELNEPCITEWAIGNRELAGSLLCLKEQIELADRIEDAAARRKRLIEIDSQLHWDVLKNCENPFMQSMMRTVYDHNDRIRIYTSTTFMEGSQLEHLEIINRILEEDKVKAKESARNHVLTSFRHIVDNFYRLGQSRLRLNLSGEN
ncbi:MAG: GntR family transcriptional regulator [Succinivibrio sp.]|nr:GntR family transcriptional regulator [Succinivibrio sp.]